MATAAERMKAMGEELQKRTEESYKRKDEYGPTFTYFKKDLTDVDFWRPKEGVHLFDIVPSFAGPNWPQDSHGVKLQEGKPVYVLDIQVHQNVGPNDAQFVCLARNFGQPCPVCEHQAELKKEIDYDQDMIKALYPKRRNVYNVICYDNQEEEDKGVQVFEIAHFFMEAKLTPLAMDARTKALIPYAHYEKGKTVQFEAKKKTYTIGERAIQGLDYVGHKFVDRNYSLIEPYDDGTTVLDDAYTLDDLIYIPSYDEVYKAYWAGIKELPEKKDEGGTRRSRRQSTPVEQPVQEEPKTTVTRRRPGRTEPAQEKATSTSTGCPHGGKFGEDIDTMGECNSCDVYDSCAQKAEELKSKKEAPPAESKEAPAPTGRVRRRPGA